MCKLIGYIGGATLLLASLTFGYSAPAQAEQSCQYAGQTYSHGSHLCMGGTTYVCDDGEWKSTLVPCIW